MFAGAAARALVRPWPRRRLCDAHETSGRCEIHPRLEGGGGLVASSNRRVPTDVHLEPLIEANAFELAGRTTGDTSAAISSIRGIGRLLKLRAYSHAGLLQVARGDRRTITSYRVLCVRRCCWISAAPQAQEFRATEGTSGRFEPGRLPGATVSCEAETNEWRTATQTPRALLGAPSPSGGLYTLTGELAASKHGAQRVAAGGEPVATINVRFGGAPPRR